MFVRTLMIGAAAFAVSGAACAQSASADPQGSQQTANSAAELVVAASAASDLDPDEDAESTGEPTTASSSRPRRAARVTTCRCGDPNQ